MPKGGKDSADVLGQLTRAFTYRDRHIFKKLYVQYVRPHTEFSVQAWSPWPLDRGGQRMLGESPEKSSGVGVRTGSQGL